MKQFKDVDIISALNAIMQKNTENFRDDFQVDKNIIMRSALSYNPLHKDLIWITRINGTHCFNEYDAFVRDRNPFNTIQSMKNDQYQKAKIFSVHISGMEEGQIKGTVTELDYPSYCKTLEQNSFPPFECEYVYADGSHEYGLDNSDVRSSFYEKHSSELPMDIYLIPEDRKSWLNTVKSVQKERLVSSRPANFDKYIQSLGGGKSLWEKLSDGKEQASQHPMIASTKKNMER